MERLHEQRHHRYALIGKDADIPFWCSEGQRVFERDEGSAELASDVEGQRAEDKDFDGAIHARSSLGCCPAPFEELQHHVERASAWSTPCLSDTDTCQDQA